MLPKGCFFHVYLSIIDPCGATLQSGSINMATAMAAALKANNNQLPTIPTNGLLTLGIHQVNADGGGPFVAEVNTDGTGKTWTAVTVTSQPPGINGLLQYVILICSSSSLLMRVCSNGPADSKITLQLPNTLACTGGSTANACVIRLNNGGANTGSIANGAGPFGGCVAVSQGKSPFMISQALLDVNQLYYQPMPLLLAQLLLVLLPVLLTRPPALPPRQARPPVKLEARLRLRLAARLRLQLEARLRLQLERLPRVRRLLVKSSGPATSSLRSLLAARQ